MKHIVGIDHAIVGVRDLEQARSGYERLGFRLTPRGRHLGRGTADHCMMFPDDHVELLGLADPGQPDDELDAFLEHGEGLMALALRSTDADATRSAWQDAGLSADLYDLDHVLDSDTALRFTNVTLPVEETGGVPMLACAHLTPDAMRQAAWLEHPNGTIGIASVTVAVEEPGALVEPMSQVFGSTNLTETDDTLAVHTGHGIVLFATPDDLDMLHPQLETSLGGGPTLATLTLLVRDLDRTGAWLEAQDLPHRRDRRGTIGLAPELTHGVMLEFVGAA